MTKSKSPPSPPCEDDQWIRPCVQLELEQNSLEKEKRQHWLEPPQFVGKAYASHSNWKASRIQFTEGH
jgi:hypothetical protein